MLNSVEHEKNQLSMKIFLNPQGPTDLGLHYLLRLVCPYTCFSNFSHLISSAADKKG